MTRDLSGDQARIILPIPPEAPPMPRTFGGLGTLVDQWCYSDAVGNGLFHVLRFESIVNGLTKKSILPMSLWHRPDGRFEWRMKQVPGPRPLYNLCQLSTNPGAEVVIVEGEKTAEAARRLFPDHVVTTSSGGSKSARQSDWNPLAGRDCLLVPDFDEPGKDYSDTVAQLLMEVGAARIHRLDISRIGSLTYSEGRECLRPEFDIPQGYDLADAEIDGWTAETLQQFLEENPQAVQELDASPLENTEEFDPEDYDPKDFEGCEVPGFRVSDDGLFRIEDALNRKTGARVERPVKISGPLYVTGYIQGPESGGWGRLVKFFDPDGKAKMVAVSAQDLAGTGIDVIRKLMAEGLFIIPNRANIDGLVTYLMTADPTERFLRAVRPGWCNQNYVLPDTTFGPGQVFSDLDHLDHRFHVRGTFEAWQEMARLAIGNSRLAFALSAAFAGPLLRPTGSESAGFHYYGKSTGGKSSVLLAASTVFGSGRNSDGLRSWSGSESGLEAAAVASCDAVLTLDEIGQADPRTFHSNLYMLINGLGKIRASVLGQLLASSNWVVVVLSGGEDRVQDMLADYMRGRRAMAGQLVRLIDLPIDAGAGMDAFENLHGFGSAREFSTHLRHLCRQNAGHAARAFLAALVADIDGATVLVRDTIESFIAQTCPPGTAAQVQRVAGRFGLVAAAGELAAAWGVLPWPQGEALRAAEICFEAWLKRRGKPTLSQEQITSLSLVRQFLSLHGASRFEDLSTRSVSAAEEEAQDWARPVVQRAGYRKLVKGTYVYSILPEAWASEICGNLDPETVAQTLLQAGYLLPGEGGRLRKKVRLPGHDSPVRCYVVSAEILSGGEDDEAQPDLTERAA